MHDLTLSPTQTRAQDAAFVAQCSFAALRHRLPLLWPVPDDVPPSPKKSYRSYYVYRGCQDLDDPANWVHLSDFDLLLRLIDFSPLRDVLAHRLGWTSARGHVPFDPLSLFLLIGWQLVNGWNRSQLLKNLQDPRYADYARLFGFRDGIFPTEGGLRHWLTALGRHSQNGDTVTVPVDEDQAVEVAVEYLNQLITQSVTLILDSGFLSPQAWEEALICPDGMIHDAASRLNCGCVTDSCYQPTSADAPALARPENRACRAVVAIPSSALRSAAALPLVIRRRASSVTAAPINLTRRTRKLTRASRAMATPASPSSLSTPPAASTSSWPTTSPPPTPAWRSLLPPNSSCFLLSIPPSTSETSSVTPPLAIPLSSASSTSTSAPAA